MSVTTFKSFSLGMFVGTMVSCWLSQNSAVIVSVVSVTIVAVTLANGEIVGWWNNSTGHERSNDYWSCCSVMSVTTSKCFSLGVLMGTMVSCWLSQDSAIVVSVMSVTIVAVTLSDGEVVCWCNKSSVR